MTKKTSKSRERKSRSAVAVREGKSETRAAGFPVVGIGASAGGLEACSELLRTLPAKTGLAFVIVLHLDPTHESRLPELLDRQCKLPVRYVADGAKIEKDNVYVIRANTSMTMDSGRLRLGARQLRRGQPMPINTFFRSMADDCGEHAIGVILSGMASDGTEGCAAIKAAGGITFAQDQESAKYTSMPRSAADAGCIDFVMRPAEIAKELVRIGNHPYIRASVKKEKGGRLQAASHEMDRLFGMLSNATGVDFAHYKQTTVERRVKRRLLLHQLDGVREYMEFIGRNPQELDELYKDILIHVTGFFRDPAAFEALRTKVLPELFKNRKNAKFPVRIWIPGCSTGEEVYSIAMIVLEHIWGESRKFSGIFAGSAQIFATDISEASLGRARNGLYTETAVADVSPERLKRFFVRVGSGYQVNKQIRDMCIFARQNVAKDPPFSNLDLISCRNLLIYLGPVLQKRVIPAFHYALKPEGYLILGGSESLGLFSDHFALVDRKARIYRKKHNSSRLISYFTGPAYPLRRPEEASAVKQAQGALSMDKEVERALVNRFVPASIVVNEEMQIVQFRGKTGAYLEPAEGHPTFSLSRMAREGLLVDLRSALSRAKQANIAVRKEGVLVRSNGHSRAVNLEVIPINGQGSGQRLYIVAFQEPGRVERKAGKKGSKAKAARGVVRRDSERVARESAELQEQLQSLIQEHEMTIEEFKTVNEEVLSGNEELQSMNEELETAKEELQSSNEELTTVNEELQSRNAELSAVNDDLLMLANVNIPVVMVGNDLRVRRFTPPAQRLLNLIPSDRGRCLTEIRSNLNLNTDRLEKLLQEAIAGAAPHEIEVRDNEERWHVMRVRPYRGTNQKVEGAVITFQDIDILKRSLDKSRAFAESVAENAREPMLVLDAELRVVKANPAFFRKFRVNPKDTENRLVYDLGNRQWDIPKLRNLLDSVSHSSSRVDDFEVQHDFPKLGPRTMILNARAVDALPGQRSILLAFEDVTEKRYEAERVGRHAALFEQFNEAIIVRDVPGKIADWNRGAEKMYGWSREEAVGKNANDLLQTRFPKSFEDTLRKLQRDGHWQGEVSQMTKSGERRPVLSRWATHQEGSAEVILEINVDLSVQRHVEENLRQLSGYLLRVQDEERRRIARELHDSTGQKLVALQMSLMAVEKQGELKGGAKKALSDGIALAQESITEIRTLSQLLHPPLLDEAGLGSAIRWLTDGVASRSGLKVEVELPAKTSRLPEAAEIALFRVVQESLNNIYRHSGATQAKVRLTVSNSTAGLEITDNGRGMPKELLESGKDEKHAVGVGILGMKERLAQLGGSLEIASGKSGTTVVAVVPIVVRQRA